MRECYRQMRSATKGPLPLDGRGPQKVTRLSRAATLVGCGHHTVDRERERLGHQKQVSARVLRLDYSKFLKLKRVNFILDAF